MPATPPGDASQATARCRSIARFAPARPLDQAQPESPDDSAPTVPACIGLALGLVDEWLSGRDPDVPAGLSQQ